MIILWPYFSLQVIFANSNPARKNPHSSPIQGLIDHDHKSIKNASSILFNKLKGGKRQTFQEMNQGYR
jgi:hypothetical protein